MTNFFPSNGSAPDNEMMRRILTPGVWAEYEKAVKRFGTEDLVCIAGLNEDQNTSAVVFSPRNAVLRLKSTPLFDRVKNELTCSASEKAEKMGAPPHHGAFWLLFGNHETTEPGIAMGARPPPRVMKELIRLKLIAEVEAKEPWSLSEYLLGLVFKFFGDGEFTTPEIWGVTFVFLGLYILFLRTCIG